MRVADTSALYAFFFGDDVHHAKARAAVAEGGPILVPAEILSETLALVERRAGFAAARDAGAALRRLPNVEVQPTWDNPWDDLLAEAWQAYESEGGKLSYPDAIVLAWCRKRRLGPLTFDRALERAAGHA